MLAILFGYFFAPASVGGRTSYASTSGTSMAPEFKTGDLVGLRKTGPVQVGDIAGYRSGSTGQVVVHRVIAEHDGLLTFKGDNNWWIDTYQPTQQEVVGKLWIHVGGAGGKINSVHPAWVLGGFSGVMAMTVIGTGKSETNRRRRAGGGSSSPFAGQGMQLLLAALLGVVVISGALAVVAFRADETVAAERVETLRHTGNFVYEGDALPGPVYLDGKLKTGDPIYVDIVPLVTSTFTYHLDAPGAEDVRGTIRLLAVTRDINGWEQSSDLVPSFSFEGPDASVGTTLDLSQFMLLAAVLQDATGSAVRYWTTAVTAEVMISGTLEGQPFQSQFQPFYTLRVTPPNEIFVETSLTRDFESAPPTQRLIAGSAFNPQQEISVSVPEQRSATLGFLIADVRVEKVRFFGAFIALGALSAAIVVAVFMAIALRAPGARIQARYGSKLVRVAQMNASPANAIALSTMDDLVRIADRYQSVILWTQAEDHDLFTVQDGTATYVYRGAA